MDTQSPKKQTKRSKEELRRREMEYDISRDLKCKEDAIKSKKIEQQHRNIYADKAILFISTLALSYLLLFILAYLFNFFFGAALAILGIPLKFITPFLHAAVWIIAIVSAFRDRSVLEDVLFRFF